MEQRDASISDWDFAGLGPMETRSDNDPHKYAAKYDRSAYGGISDGCTNCSHHLSIVDRPDVEFASGQDIWTEENADVTTKVKLSEALSGDVQVGRATEGLQLRLRPSWGRGQGMSMYRQQTILDAVPMGMNAHRTELELGYGIPWKEGAARSVMGVTRLPQGRMYRLGGELRPWERLSLSVFGLAHGHETALGDIGVNVQGTLRY